MTEYEKRNLEAYNYFVSLAPSASYRKEDNPLSMFYKYRPFDEYPRFDEYRQDDYLS